MESFFKQSRRTSNILKDLAQSVFGYSDLFPSKLAHWTRYYISIPSKSIQTITTLVEYQESEY